MRDDPLADNGAAVERAAYRGPTIALLVMRPRHVLTGPQNLMFEVDAAEEAKHVAVYRYELTGELYDDDEILDFFYNDITELEQEQRDEITFECSKR